MRIKKVEEIFEDVRKHLNFFLNAFRNTGFSIFVPNIPISDFMSAHIYCLLNSKKSCSSQNESILLNKWENKCQLLFSEFLSDVHTSFSYQLGRRRIHIQGDQMIIYAS